MLKAVVISLFSLVFIYSINASPVKPEQPTKSVEALNGTSGNGTDLEDRGLWITQKKRIVLEKTISIYQNSSEEESQEKLPAVGNSPVKTTIVVDQKTSSEEEPKPVKKIKCPPKWEEYGSKCYRFFNESVSWPKAETICQNNGAHLVSIHSKEENDYVHELTANIENIASGALWIGMKRKKTGANDLYSSEWTDGTKVAFGNAPKNFASFPYRDNHLDAFYNGHVEECISQYIDEHEHTWNDLWCELNMTFVCKRNQFELF